MAVDSMFESDPTYTTLTAREDRAQTEIDEQHLVYRKSIYDENGERVRLSNKCVLYRD